ncbi:MAG TPA: hypothetical protein P5175_13580, partial [Anaerohalosphaeraceae bacterium]|nr:hypothetical protein [Anaerohalosphaeraceae bacterium]
PALPGVLVQSEIDFVDMHGYLPYDNWNTILSSSLWSSIDKKLKPFTCGEFGALRTSYANVYSAADALYNFRETILDSGFHGGLLFTWDTYSHTRWTMMEDGAIINERLKPEQWSNWQFNTDSFTQFWYAGQGVSNFDARFGSLLFDITGSDPYIYSPLTRLDTERYRYFKLRLKNQSSGTKAQIFWTTKTASTWTETRSITFDIAPNSSTFKTYVIDLQSNANWSGVAKQFRFDPVENAITSGSYEIDFVEIIEATASDSAYDP